jgi:hypothetical protein
MGLAKPSTWLIVSSNSAIGRAILGVKWGKLPVYMR